MIQGTETVIIVRRTPGETDEFGIEAETKTEIPVSGVLVAWNSSATVENVNRVSVETDLTFYFPAGTVLNTSDDFIYSGSLWEMQGAPQYWTPPAGFELVAGVVVNANRIGDQ